MQNQQKIIGNVNKTQKMLILAENFKFDIIILYEKSN